MTQGETFSLLSKFEYRDAGIAVAFLPGVIPARTLILVLITFICLLAQAEKRAYFWGGGGEPFSKSSTKFDPHFEAHVRPLLNKGWSVKVLYGKGHPESEKLVEFTLGKGSVLEFSLRNVQAQLAHLTSELKSNKITQVLFVIATHGDDPIKNADEKTHRVLLTDINLKKSMSLDLLIPIRDLTEKQKVPMAILDHSCYSGASLVLSGPNTCVVSASSSQDVSYDEFTMQLIHQLVQGETLEKAFLVARRNSNDFAGPEISTRANSLLKETLATLNMAVMPHKNPNHCHACTLHGRFLIEHQSPPLKLTDFSDEERRTLLQMRRIKAEALESHARYAAGGNNFDANEAIKLRSLIQFFHLERQLYHSVYPRLQNTEPTACSQFKL